MAGRGLGSLTLDLIVRMAGFERGLDKAGRTLDSRMKSMQKRAEQFGKAMGVALAAAASAAGYAIKSAIDRADELSKGAQKIGVTTEALSRLAYAADLSDVSLEQLQGGLARMTKFQAEAAQGNEEAAKTFAAFGIAIKDSAGNLRDTEAVLQDFARVFAALPDGPQKTALALRVFGRAGAELIPLLNSGADGLADMAAEADRLGVTLSTETGKQAEEFNDSLTRLKSTMQGVVNQILRPLLPELNNLSLALQGLAEDGTNSFSFADAMGRDLAELSKSIRLISVEIGYLKKLWNEEGLFDFSADGGAFGALRRAQEDFAKGEAARALQGVRYGGGPTGGRGAGAGRRAGQADAAAREAEEAARKLLATEDAATQGTQRNTAASKAATEAARAREQAERDLAEAVENAANAQAQFTLQLEDLVAAQGGPLAESQLRYKREEEALRKLWAEGSTPNAEELRIALEALHAARDQDAEAIRKQLDTGGLRLEQLQNELNLIQMTSQAERDRAAFLLDNPTATQAQADAAAALQGQIDETRVAIAAADDLRSSMTDAFASILDGSKSAKDAFKDLAASILADMARIAAQKIVESIFGGMGTPMGGGGGGGGFLSFLGSLFGGGRASGGPVSAGVPYLVGERGPEIVVPSSSGTVIPNHRMGGTTINVSVSGEVSKKTRHDIANDVARKLEYAQRGMLR